MRLKALALFATVALAITPLQRAAEVATSQEAAAAQDFGSSGPTESKGLSEVAVVGLIPLAADFPELAGKNLRMCTIVLDPGGAIAVHKHVGRPGIAYVLDGEVLDFRSDSPEPVVHRKGDVVRETPGLVHWLENRGSVPVRVVAVDIAPE